MKGLNGIIVTALSLLGFVGIGAVARYPHIWFPVLLLMTLSVALGGFIWWAKKVSDDSDDYAGQVVGAIFSGVLLFILLLTWTSTYTGSIREIADLRAFSDATKSAYEYTITATEEVEIKAVIVTKPSPQEILNVGELAYLQLAPRVSERIKDLRDRIEWYNQTRERIIQWNRFWISQSFVCDLPSDIKPIIIK